jgi:hypothetical protein
LPGIVHAAARDAELVAPRFRQGVNCTVVPVEDDAEIVGDRQARQAARNLNGAPEARGAPAGVDGPAAVVDRIVAGEDVEGVLCDLSRRVRGARQNQPVMKAS